MEDRRFDEVNLRAMLQQATSYREDVVEDRWIIESRHKRSAWEIVVEPDSDAELLVVVTAYPIWST